MRNSNGEAAAYEAGAGASACVRAVGARVARESAASSAKRAMREPAPSRAQPPLTPVSAAAKGGKVTIRLLVRDGVQRCTVISALRDTSGAAAPVPFGTKSVLQWLRCSSGSGAPAQPTSGVNASTVWEVANFLQDEAVTSAIEARVAVALQHALRHRRTPLQGFHPPSLASYGNPPSSTALTPTVSPCSAALPFRPRPSSDSGCEGTTQPAAPSLATGCISTPDAGAEAPMDAASTYKLASSPCMQTSSAAGAWAHLIHPRLKQACSRLPQKLLRRVGLWPAEPSNRRHIGRHSVPKPAAQAATALQQVGVLGRQSHRPGHGCVCRCTRMDGAGEPAVRAVGDSGTRHLCSCTRPHAAESAAHSLAWSEAVVVLVSVPVDGAASILRRMPSSLLLLLHRLPPHLHGAALLSRLAGGELSVCTAKDLEPADTVPCLRNIPPLLTHAVVATKLVLSGAALYTAAVHTVPLIFTLSALRSLDLSQNSMYAAGAARFADAFVSGAWSQPIAHTLEHLDLSCNGFDLQAVVHLGPCVHLLQALTSLNFSCNPLGGAGMELLGRQLQALPRLRQLDVSCVGTGMAGGVRDAPWPVPLLQLPVLDRLDLRGNDLSYVHALAGRLIARHAWRELRVQTSSVLAELLPAAGQPTPSAHRLVPHALELLDTTFCGDSLEDLLAYLHDAPRLRCLCLRWQRPFLAAFASPTLEPATPWASLARLARLTQLHLSGEVTSHGVQALTALSSLQSLHLHCIDEEFMAEHKAALQVLTAQLPALQDLALAFPFATFDAQQPECTLAAALLPAEAAGGLVLPGCLSTLTSLSLSGLVPQDAAPLTKCLRQLSGLSMLQLAPACFWVANASALAAALCALPLHVLELQACEPPELAVKALLPHLPRLQALEALSFSQSALPDNALDTLVPALATLPRLTHLDLSFNAFLSWQVALLRLVPLASLQVVNLLQYHDGVCGELVSLHCIQRVISQMPMLRALVAAPTYGKEAAAIKQTALARGLEILSSWEDLRRTVDAPFQWNTRMDE